MSNSPRVSVIVAAYNYGRYIGDALRSVEAQTLHDWECIVVDDASTDDTAAIVQGIVARDPRFRYMRLERNGGVAAARNAGIAQARGEYLQMLDADDMIGPAKLERHVAFMDTHTDVAVVYSGFVHFTDSPALHSPGEYKADERLTGKGSAIIRRLLKGNVFRMNTLLLRAAVVRAAGGFHPAFRHIEDWDLWLRLAAAGHRFHYLDDPACMVGVRNSPGSLSKDHDRMRRNVLPVLHHLWNGHGLSFTDRCLLMVRYVDTLLEQLLVGRLRPARVEGPKSTLSAIAIPLALLMLPVWLLARPFRSSP